MKVILASGSPRRKELLSLIVKDYEVIVSGADETLQEGLTPEEQAERLSYLKAKYVFDNTSGDRIVIGSDTMVVKNSKIYGKPTSKENVKEIIKELLEGDKSNDVITGLCVLIQDGDKYIECKTHDLTKVYFKDMSDDEIEKWAESGNAMDKAGAYGLQSEFCVHIEKIDGNYSTVVGLPIHKVYDIVKKYI